MKRYNKTELDCIRRSGALLGAALSHVSKAVKAGISTLQLDKIVDDFIVSGGGEPCFKNYNGYKFATCISVNNEIIHTIPRADSVLREGDIVSIDAGVRLDGFCTDAARTFGVGKIGENAQALIDATRESFFVAIDGLKAGDKVGEIGRKIERFIKTNTKYSILTNFFGHGIGRNVHEEPLIPNFKPSNPRLVAACRTRLAEGAVICIEPMINEGAPETKLLADGWTVLTADGKLSAHYENTVIVHEDRVEVVTGD